MINLPRMDPHHRHCSLLLVEPKERFIEIMRPYFTPIPPFQSCIEDAYHPEENGAWLIPGVDGFRVGQFDKFIDSIKPSLLRSEFLRFVGSLAKYPDVLDELPFEELITMSIRDFVGDIRELLGIPTGW